MHSLLELTDAAYKGIRSKAAAGYFSFLRLSVFALSWRESLVNRA
jgi:hypothetical protein